MLNITLAHLVFIKQHIPYTTRILFIIGIIVFLASVVFLLRKNALELKYTLCWLLTGFVLLVIGIFPDILAWIAALLGFEVASNALFVILFGFVLLILLSLTSIVSRQTRRIKLLIQANALLEKRVRELETSNNNI